MELNLLLYSSASRVIINYLQDIRVLKVLFIGVSWWLKHILWLQHPQFDSGCRPLLCLWAENAQQSAYSEQHFNEYSEERISWGTKSQ